MVYTCALACCGRLLFCARCWCSSNVALFAGLQQAYVSCVRFPICLRAMDPSWLQRCQEYLEGWEALCAEFADGQDPEFDDAMDVEDTSTNQIGDQPPPAGPPALGSHYSPTLWSILTTSITANWRVLCFASLQSCSCT